MHRSVLYIWIRARLARSGSSGVEGESGREEVEDAAEEARERALQVGHEAADVGEVGVALDERRVHNQRAAADERRQRAGHVQLHGEGAVGVGRRARHHLARAPQLHVRVCDPPAGRREPPWLTSIQCYRWWVHVLGKAGEVAMSMRLPVLQGTTPVMMRRPNLASAAPTTHAAVTTAAAKRRSALDDAIRRPDQLARVASMWLAAGSFASLLSKASPSIYRTGKAYTVVLLPPSHTLKLTPLD